MRIQKINVERNDLVRPYLISDIIKGQSVVVTSSGEAELHVVVSVMKDMMS